MYIDYDNYKEFEDFFVSLSGQYLSPGGAAARLGVTRQLVNNWISRDNWIVAHRYKGPQGDFVIVPLEELNHEKIKNHIRKFNK